MLKESKLDSDDEAQPEQTNTAQPNVTVTEERVVPPIREPTEAEKKGKKKEKTLEGVLIQNQYPSLQRGVAKKVESPLFF